MLDGTNHSVFRKLPTKYWSTDHGSGDYYDRDYPEWKYSCEAGEYTTDSLLKLVYAIFMHRFCHLLQGEGFRDCVQQITSQQSFWVSYTSVSGGYPYR